MNQLIKQTQLDRDKTALINPESYSQVKEIADRSARLHQALKGMKGYEHEYYKAFEVMIEAYRVIGLQLLEMENSHGGDRRSEEFQVRGADLKILADLEIPKQRATEWRNIALVPRADIEEYVNAHRAEAEPVTKAQILEIARNYKSAVTLCAEEAQKVQANLDAFCIRAKILIEHLRKFPDSRTAIPKEFLKHLKVLEEVTDTLNRAVL